MFKRSFIQPQTRFQTLAFNGNLNHAPPSKRLFSSQGLQLFEMPKTNSDALGAFVNES
jgi:hypothetical protein